MTCRDLDDFVSSGSANWVQPEGYGEHLRACQRCRGLVRLLEEAGKGLVPSESQLMQIKTGIVENLQPVRPLPPSRVFLAACAIIFLFVAAAGVLRLGTNGWAALNLWQRAGMFTTLGASAILLAGSMVRLMVPGSRHILPPAALPVGILLALMLVIATAFRSHGELAFVADGLVCIKNGLTYSVPAALLFWLILRRGAILSPKLIGAVTGGLAGLIGLSVLEINCPNLNIFHILVWHWGVVLISSLAGALVGAATEYFDRPRNQMF